MLNPLCKQASFSAFKAVWTHVQSSLPVHEGALLLPLAAQRRDGRIVQELFGGDEKVMKINLLRHQCSRPAHLDWSDSHPFGKITRAWKENSMKVLSKSFCQMSKRPFLCLHSYRPTKHCTSPRDGFCRRCYHRFPLHNLTSFFFCFLSAQNPSAVEDINGFALALLQPYQADPENTLSNTALDQSPLLFLCT